jgi:hypothetical protein
MVILSERFRIAELTPYLTMLSATISSDAFIAVAVKPRHLLLSPKISLVHPCSPNHQILDCLSQHFIAVASNVLWVSFTVLSAHP